MRKTFTQRKCNLYITAMPINEKKQAEALSKEISWDILVVLREAGAKGMTAKEIAEMFKRSTNNITPLYKYPISTIYQALDNLEQGGWIESHRASLSWGRPSSGERKRIGRDRGGRPLKVYTCNIFCTPSDPIDDEFYERLEPILKKYVPEIKKTWVETLQKIINEFNSEDLKDLLPKDEIHECGFSHEGYEFITAISLGIIDLLEEEEEWKNFARKIMIMK